MLQSLVNLQVLMARRTIRQHIALGVLAGIFVALATLYGVVNPVFEAPDEIWHYLYARSIGEGQGLPVQPEVRDGDIWAQQEASQPPLYYLLAGASIHWVDFSPLQQVIRPNDHASIGTPASEDNKNRFVHNSTLEAFPYRSDALAVHVIRLVTTVLGLGAVLATYGTAWETWGRRRSVAFGAAAIAAFTPQFLYLSGAVSNDPAVACFSALTLWLVVRAGRHGCSPRYAAALGLAAGLAGLSKLSGFGIAPLAVAAAFWIGYRQSRLRQGLLLAGIVLGTFSVTVFWWLVRNWLLYGELVPLKTFLRREALVNQWPSVHDLWRDAPGLIKSFWGLFGWFNILAGDAFYSFYETLAALATIGLIILVLRHRDWPVGASWGLFWTGAWLLVTVAGLLRYHLIVQAFQGRLLFPALSALALLLFLGLHSLVPPRFSRPTAPALAAVMLFIAVLTPFLYIMPAYAQPRLRPVPEAIERTSQPLAWLGEEIELLDARLNATELLPGEDLALRLHWRARRPLEKDYSVFVHLVDWRRQVIVQKDTFPGGGNYATSLWPQGEIVPDDYRLRIPLDFPSPTVVEVELGLYWAKKMERLPVLTATAQVRDSAILMPRVRVIPRLESGACRGMSADLTFGGKAVLRGFGLDSHSVTQGGKLTGLLCWEATDLLDHDYTVFVQLIGPSGLVAQDDAQPRGGAFPTTAWRVGDLVAHPFALPLTTQAAPGRYQLVAGLYDLSNGRRLWARDRDFAALTEVEVVAP